MTRPGNIALAAGLAMMMATGGAAAQFVPQGQGLSHDPVTGYLCVTAACDVVRLPDADCICQKENPTERNLSRLVLTCSTREAGEWRQCPVKPRYGISR